MVDRTRGTDADPKNDVPAKDDRVLPTVVLYPTTNRHDDAVANGHRIAPGRFPLFVFAHGVTASGPAYVGVVKQIVAAGYVVALPTFPLTSGPKGWGNLGQVVNQPGDVSFVIDQLEAQGTADGGLLGGHLAPAVVAVGGHSLGAITSLFFYNSCCRNTKIAAVVAVSGLLFPASDTSDNYDDPPSDLPLLLLHGQKDKTVPYDSSVHTFDSFTKVPRAFATFPDATHVGILVSPSFAPTVIAFLDLELRHDPRRWRALGAKLAADGDATMQVAGGVPKPG